MMMKKIRLVLFALFACLLLSGCGKEKEFTVTFNSDGGSQIETQTVGENDKVVKPENPTRDGYLFDGWYIGEEEYDFNSEVTEDITLTAKWYTIVNGDGSSDNQCTLTCKDGYKLVNGDSANCKCQKVVEVTGIKLSQGKVTLTVGESKTITATVNPKNADDKTVTWKTSDKKVATVKNGKITAVGAGTAKITVTAGKATETITVTVNKKTTEPVAVSEITLSNKTLELVAGESKTVTATVKPTNATNKTVTWTTSDKNVAKVENGKITAVAKGTATITATADGKTATVKVTVVSKDSATLSKALASITAKNLTKGNTSINFTYSGCTITLTDSTVSSANSSRTEVEAGVVTKLYRTASAGNISATYKVTCGSESDTKTVKHTIAKSTYTYTADFNGSSYVIYVDDATNYTLSGGKTLADYNATAGGVQAPKHVPGTEYRLTFKNDSSTVYAVKSAE